MGPDSGSFTHQFTNKRDGPLLAQLRHAVDAKGRVSTVRHRAKSAPLNKTRFKHFTVEPFRFRLFTDPGLAHACLLGSPSCSRFWNTVSKVTGLAIWSHWTLPPPCTQIETRQRWESGLGSKLAGWVSVQYAKDTFPINHSGPLQYEHHKSVSPYKHQPDDIYIWEARRVLI